MKTLQGNLCIFYIVFIDMLVTFLIHTRFKKAFHLTIVELLGTYIKHLNWNLKLKKLIENKLHMFIDYSFFCKVM